MMQRDSKILMWITVTGAMAVVWFIILPRLARAKGGSFVIGEAKLSDCTNRLITIRVKKLPSRTRGVVLAVPKNHVTNEVAGLSGYFVINARPPITNAFTLSEINRVRDVFPLERDPVTGLNLLSTENALAAYSLGDVSALQPKRTSLLLRRSYAFSFHFSNAPPPEAALWLRWRQPPRKTYRLE